MLFIKFRNILLSITITLVFIFIITFINRKDFLKLSLPSLEEQIGQMLIVGFYEAFVNTSTPIVQDILAKRIGGVILFDYNSRENNNKRNIISLQQVTKLTSDLQKFTKQSFASTEQKNNPSANLLIATDYEGGLVNRLKSRYGFSLETVSAEEVGRWSNAQIKKYAMSMAVILQESGINYNLAPVVDVNRNINSRAIGLFHRSFSTVPQRVGSVAEIFVRVFEEHRIASALKHFPGHGSSSANSDLEFVDVTDTWSEEELIPYKQLFKRLKNKKNLMSVLVTGIVNRKMDPSGLPANLSFDITTNLLRNQLGYSGIIITDDIQQKAITDRYTAEESIIKAIQAGCDLLLFGNNLPNIQVISPHKIIQIVLRAIEQEQITSERIALSYRRIQKLKSSLSKQTGLFSFFR